MNIGEITLTREERKRIPRFWWHIIKDYKRIHRAAVQEQVPGIRTAWILVFKGVATQDASYLEMAERNCISVKASLLKQILGLAYSTLGDREKAKTYLREAATLEPSLENLRCYAATCFRKHDDAVEEQVTSQKIVDLNPADRASNMYLAAVYMGKKEYERAYPFVSSLLKNWPKWPGTLYTHGNYLYCLEKYQEALTIYVKYYKGENKDPSCDDTLIRMADCCLELNDYKNAKRYIDEVERLTPNNPKLEGFLEEHEKEQINNIKTKSFENPIRRWLNLTKSKKLT